RPSAIDVTVAARQIQPGELVVVTFETPRPPGHIVVRAFGRDITPYLVSDGESQTWRALVGIDLDVRPGTYPLVIRGGGAGGQITRDLVVQPKTFRTRRLTVDPDFVTPPPSVAERIAQENALLAATWRSSAPDRLWSADFVRPVIEPANSAF